MRLFSPKCAATHGDFLGILFLPNITGVKTGQFTTMLIALAIFDAAFFGEIVRAGILGVPKEHFEGACSLGLSYAKTMRLSHSWDGLREGNSGSDLIYGSG